MRPSTELRAIGSLRRGKTDMLLLVEGKKFTESCPKGRDQDEEYTLFLWHFLYVSVPFNLSALMIV
jgi:hypothetical protein